jgi:hypothetical protein
MVRLAVPFCHLPLPLPHLNFYRCPLLPFVDKTVQVSLFLISDYKFSFNVLGISLLVPCSSPSYHQDPRIRNCCVLSLVVIISLAL